MKKMKLSEKPAFLRHSIICLNTLLNAVIDCDELSFNEKEKFVEIIGAAKGTCQDELDNQVNEITNMILEPINQICREFKNARNSN